MPSQLWPVHTGICQLRPVLTGVCVCVRVCVCVCVQIICSCESKEGPGQFEAREGQEQGAQE